VFYFKYHSTSKETYQSALTTKLEDNSNPLDYYVNGWINNVRNMYQAKSVVEGYTGSSRTFKNFDKLKYLDANAIKTGKVHY
jgi:hypothetical protein